jgi:hypothetical protein
VNKLKMGRRDFVQSCTFLGAATVLDVPATLVERSGPRAFIAATISYAQGSCTIFHDYYPHCKDRPWSVSTVSCLPHSGFPKLHALNSGVWSFSNYTPTENGFSATLTLAPLNMNNAKDQHLYTRFMNYGQLRILVNFNSPNQDFLTLNLTP